MQKEQVRKYNEYLAEITNRKRKLELLISNIDLKQQDILHFIETEKYDAVVMVKATKKLKLLRQERRVIKQELSVVTTIWERIKNPMKEQNDFKSGVYKTDVIKEFLN